ncbi:MAG: hypothetical protein HZC42_09485 [Candidatus Eisenbacteria bacterium]|nr:hypothetical protein [Candidatus Eisenbacteria bacterium]
MTTPVRRILLLVLGAALSVGAPARAQLPTPLDRPGLFGFPGSVASPGSAASAGVGLADRWLGDEPFDNPAASPARGVSVSPLLLRVSRQDLRSNYRDYDETAAFLDGAGAWISVPLRGVGIVLYGQHPALRREENAFTRGQLGSPVPPATLITSATSREARAGLALSAVRGALRFGVAGEWTRRSDAYDYEERSGDPAAGTRHADFSGDAAGFAVGARLTGAGRVMLGAAVRYAPALTLTGGWRSELLTGDSAAAVSVGRGAAWEGGLSARVTVSPMFHALAALGGRGSRNWDAFGVRCGAGAEWRVGGEVHDAREPWTVRFGLGQEVQSGVPEPRAGVVALGFGWKMESVTLDFAALRRSLGRAGEPTSYDDRVLASATVGF